MAILNQSTEYKTFLAWYGSCTQETCESFALDNHADKIEIAYEWNESGFPRKWSSSAPAFLQDFTTLSCGHNYFITLKPGSGSVDIPNLTVSLAVDKNSTTQEDYGRIAETCIDPTPPARHLEFRWHNIGNLGEVLQVKNIEKPTDVAFTNRDFNTNWSTVYMYTNNPSSYDLGHSVWPTAAVKNDVPYSSVEWNGLKVDLVDAGSYKKLVLGVASYIPCMPDDLTKFSQSAGSIELLQGREFGYRPSDFTVTNVPPYVVSIYDKTGWLVAKMNMTSKPAEGTESHVYWDSVDGACHSGVLKQRVSDDNYIVELDMISPAQNAEFTLSPDVEVPGGDMFIFHGDTDISDDNANGVSNIWPVVKKS